MLVSRKPGLNVPKNSNGGTALCQPSEGELQAYDHNANGLEGYVGPDNPKASWHEWGTKRIPARPVLGGALTECEPQIVALIGKHAAEVMERG